MDENNALVQEISDDVEQGQEINQVEPAQIERPNLNYDGVREEILQQNDQLVEDAFLHQRHEVHEDRIPVEENLLQEGEVPLDENDFIVEELPFEDNQLPDYEILEEDIFPEGPVDEDELPEEVPMEEPNILADENQRQEPNLPVENQNDNHANDEMPNIAAFRLRDVLHFFHGGRRHVQGQMQALNRLRNWVVRRRGRLRPDDGSEADDSSDDEDSNADSSKKEFKEINFDKNLPTAHAYLGEMEECSGVTYQDQDTYQTLSVLYVHDFVLIPGQTLPLLFGQPNEVSMIRRIMLQPDKTFGVLTRKYSFREDEEEPSCELYDYGCTAEIRSFQDKEEYEINSIRVVVVGRQKFKVMEKRRQMDGNILAKVKILEDVHLPELNHSVGLHGCSKPDFLVGLSFLALHFMWSMAHNRLFHPYGVILVTAGSIATSASKSLWENHKRKFTSSKLTSLSTAWSPWVYRMYDVDYLRMLIFNEMREWNQQLEERHCPTGASDFSFWVITNLPVSDSLKLQLLQMNSAVQRLRFELHLFQKCTTLSCSDCGQAIANRSDVFSMSVSGPMAAYVNPGGVVHETLTLYKASNLALRGRKSTVHSWFPGYAWTICECRSCGRHMGWKFSATKSSLKPQKFWGLTRSALTHMVTSPSGSNLTYGSDEGGTSTDESQIFIL